MYQNYAPSLKKMSVSRPQYDVTILIGSSKHNTDVTELKMVHDFNSTGDGEAPSLSFINPGESFSTSANQNL